jgi:serine phosphatase RsbU (regulator of sigma subunit)
MTDKAANSTATPGEQPGRSSALSKREVRAAIHAEAGLYVLGGLLCSTALLIPHVRAPEAVAAVGFVALFVAAGLFVAAERERGGLTLAFAGDLWGVVLIAVLCASAGGASSPFALIYLFAIGHAAGFQPRGRYVIVSIASLVAFLLPLTYEHVPGTFGAVALVGIVLAVMTTGVIHLALNSVREHRRRLKFLIDATASFDTSLDPAEALRNLAHAAVPELAELCVIDLVDRDGMVGTTVAAALDADVAIGVETLRRRVPLDLASDHPVARALSSGEPVVVDDLTDANALAQAAQSDEHERFMRSSGYRSAAVFPMIARGRTHGAISFLHLQREASYSREVLNVLEDLAGRAAMAFDNASLYAERTRVAQTLRRSLMPSVLPAIPGLELASFFRPVGAGNEVGGDFYDVFGDERSCWLVVGDVCGKGAEAAALTGFLRHTTVAYAREESSPGKVLTQVNRVMLDQDFEGRFATAILVNLRLDGSEVAVTVASAGHPAALLAKDGGATTQFGQRGSLLGIFDDPMIEEATTVLSVGDSLALYTDGLMEAHAPALTVTTEQMVDQLQRSSPAGAQETIDALLGLVELDEHVRDDIAILSARVVPVAATVAQLRPSAPSARLHDAGRVASGQTGGGVA